MKTYILIALTLVINSFAYAKSDISRSLASIQRVDHARDRVVVRGDRRERDVLGHEHVRRPYGDEHQPRGVRRGARRHLQGVEEERCEPGRPRRHHDLNFGLKAEVLAH